MGKLEIISGKGGVGKSMVAAAMAEGYAKTGQRTLLTSFDQLGSSHPVYGTSAAYAPHTVKPNLDISYLDAEHALREYVKRKMTLSFAYLPVLENPAVARFIDALPLFNELLMLGKLYDLTGNQSPYDRVVLDAPATGHCKLLLQIPAVALDTLVAGPIYDNARKIRDMLTNAERTSLTIVTLPEETPLREACELASFALDDVHMACTRVIVNRCRSERFTASELRQLAAWGESAAVASAIAPIVKFDALIAANQTQQLKQLDDLPVSVKNIPDFPVADGAALLKSISEALP